LKYNPEIHHRKTIRLKNYDYCQEGLYFITICTKNREKLFAEIVGAGSSRPNDDLFKTTEQPKLILNEIGMLIENEYSQLEDKYEIIKCHQYVIMPNHFHCIIEIIKNQKGGKTPPLPEILGYFKFQTTKKYNEAMKLKNEKYLSLWQRNYYENIIRNEETYNKIVDYIENNPVKWGLDKYYMD